MWGAKKSNPTTHGAGLMASACIKIADVGRVVSSVELQSEMERHMGGLAYNRTWRCTVPRDASIDPPLSLPPSLRGRCLMSGDITRSVEQPGPSPSVRSHCQPCWHSRHNITTRHPPQRCSRTLLMVQKLNDRNLKLYQRNAQRVGPGARVCVAEYARYFF